MRASMLRHELTLERPTYSTDSSGVRTTTWVDLGVVFCSVMPLKGEERVEGLRQKGVVTHSIVTRWEDGLRPDYRLRDPIRQRTFEIDSVEDLDEGGRWARIVAKEVTA